jgi:diguanylate cyclase (GGDEF)-like protein
LISFVYVLSGSLAFAGASLAYRKRAQPGRAVFLAFCLITCLIALSSCAEYNSGQLADKLLWRNVQQIGYFYLPVCFFLFALVYARKDKGMTELKVALLHLVPTVGLILLYTNGYHHWMRRSVRLDAQGTLVITRTAVSFLFTGYGFILFLAGLFLLLRTMVFTRGSQKHQLFIILLAISLPTLISLMRLLQLFPITDYTAFIAIAYLPSSFLLVWGVIKYRLFENVPITRNDLFEAMEEGIVVLDAGGRILDTNESAQIMLSRIRNSWDRLSHGEALASSVPDIQPWVAAHFSMREQTVELSYKDRNGAPFDVSVKVIPVFNGPRYYAGSMCVLTDTSDMNRSHRELRRRADTDGLTGIYNRRGFIERTERWISEAKEAGEPLCMVVADIDSFKGINDRFGHPVGDRALCALVETVQRVVAERSRSLFGRMGGEEFGLVFRNVTEEQAMSIAEEIRGSVEQERLVITNNVHIRFTLSMGISFMDRDISHFEQLYMNADHSLYQAKRNGKNQIHLERLEEMTLRIR